MTSVAKVGLVILVALAVLGYFVLKIEDIDLGRSAGKRTVKVVLDNVAGLEERSAVRIAGVRKGTVESVRVRPDGRAEVTLEIDDDVPLHSDATARVANLGLLGEQYVDIHPGSMNAPTLPTGQVVELRGSGTASIDEVTSQVSAIATDVKAITESLRAVVGGPAGQQRLGDILGNVHDITAQVRDLVAANRMNVDATLGNAREITAQLRVTIPRLADTLDRVARQISSTVGENRGDVRQVVENLRGLSGDLRTTADNLNAITGQVRTGEGTMGKLIFNGEAHDRLTAALGSVESGVNELRNTLGRVGKIQLDLGIRSDYYAGLAQGPDDRGIDDPDFRGNNRTTLGLRLVPDPAKNRFYNIELSDDPRGKRKEKLTVDTRTNPATGQSETVINKQTKYERDYLVSGQVGWNLDDLAVRIGLFDSTGGVGADYRFNNKLRVTGEVFDFGQSRDENPHIRLFGEYTVRQEKPNTPRLFVTTGVDNALNDTAFTFGGGIRWRDEDLKYLLGSIPVGN